ncbi:MAG TPA: adenylosuccinate synthase [Thermoanaerobaculia bacterium]|jgi:adenylosuccinate synthase|nr:adenylosuccinate synthase [Thermoanaerobaculia bacterium]
MANVVIVGMQWGDEGKGKIVDLLCPAFDGVVRYQGGHNAGHTVKFRDHHFSLRLIPSGILHAEMVCVMGNGMVIAPDAFLEEVDQLAASGVRFDGRLFVSNRAHVLLPLHAALDRAREESRGSNRIGTTSRGIGPAYASKASRYGLRTCDLTAPDLADRLENLRHRAEVELAGLGAPTLAALGADVSVEQCRGWAERLEPYLRDTEQLLNSWIAGGRSLLFEGAQGTLLDLDHGTYPYVTSSNSTAGGACTGTGVPPTRIDGAIGVLKAYTTRVGGGPFPCELTDARGDFLRQRGNEFGTVTGRPRRCGWLDTVVARYARLLNGIDTVALTKLDVLDDFDEIPVCVAYRRDGKELRDLPPDRHSLETAEPVLRTFKGWKQSTAGILAEADLPAAARGYIDFIAQELDAPITLVSTGPRREETLLRDHPTLHRLTSGQLGKVLEQR